MNQDFGNNKEFRSKIRTIYILEGAICLILSLPLPAEAQLSPGKLSQPHAHLEGLTRCSNCHRLGNREVQDKCLDCHREIAAMRATGKGLHAGEDYDHCIDCHVEHQGRDYDLVFWPDGRDGFEHQVTGFPLTGAHGKKDCRTCHTSSRIPEPASLKAMGKDLNRTYLGLDPRCASCHEDVHRGQFASTCTSCHDTQAWKPAAGFDHSVTAFPLTGRHLQTDCAGCHKVDSDLKAVRFTAVAHQRCTDCHPDPHGGNLGSDCVKCHTTTNWKDIQGDGFDHSRTRYPLEGKHRQVTCARCHSEGRKKPAFARCADCHEDLHLGSARNRDRLARCEDCHSTDGFKPAEFPLARHQETGFPLIGAHLATPCLACHQPTSRQTGARQVAELVLAHDRCTDCHGDPHPEGMARLALEPQLGCASCHDQQSWQVEQFDHARTGFVLAGKHGQAACTACHKNEVKTDFRGLKSHCVACHEDVHRGQFADRQTPDGQHTACDVCHDSRDWLAGKFDHEKDSRFPLRGGHERTPCGQCHLNHGREKEQLVIYKPLPVDCKDCHVGGQGSGQQGEQP